MPNTYRLVTGAHALTTAHMRSCLARQAVRTPILWLICGNFVDLQLLIYEVARRAGGEYYRVMKDHIAISRAETCYQVAALLRKTRASGTPIFVTDLLLHFYDTKVRDEEAAGLFMQSLLALKELCKSAPVIVSASPGTERTELYALLFQHAGRLTRLSEG